MLHSVSGADIRIQILLMAMRPLEKRNVYMEGLLVGKFEERWLLRKIVLPNADRYQATAVVSACVLKSYIIPPQAPYNMLALSVEMMH